MAVGKTGVPKGKGRRGGFLVLAFLLLAGCSQEVAQVGEIAISDKDLSLRSQVSEVYYPGSGKRYVALAQLLQGYLSLQILESLGQKADPSTLEAEAKRIEKDTKAPEALKRIQAVYVGDPKAYLLTFVRVVYAERVLYQEVFPHSPEIQGERHQKAEAFLQEVLRSPSSLGPPRPKKRPGARAAGGLPGERHSTPYREGETDGASLGDGSGAGPTPLGGGFPAPARGQSIPRSSSGWRATR